MMNESNAEAAARELLATLEQRLAAKDLDAILGCFTDDAILIADDSEYLTTRGTVEYLGVMAAMEPVISWVWDHVLAAERAPGVLDFAAVGSLEFCDPSGASLAPARPFRLSCVAVDVGGRWKIAHFHGSRRDL